MSRSYIAYLNKLTLIFAKPLKSDPLKKRPQPLSTPQLLQEKPKAALHEGKVVTKVWGNN